ncbi:MAG: hypothetical protein FWC97_09735, partial [Treponema sp.]|nr:hypothetical protein [Treponema sp.]
MKNIKTMKRVCSGIGIVLLVFLLAACNHLNNINDVSIADDGFLGSTLNLSGSMLAVFFDEENRVHIFEQLNEDMIVSSNLGGEGMFSN